MKTLWTPDELKSLLRAFAMRQELTPDQITLLDELAMSIFGETVTARETEPAIKPISLAEIGQLAEALAARTITEA